MTSGKWKSLFAAVTVCLFILTPVSAQSERSDSQKSQVKKFKPNNRKSVRKNLKYRNRKCSGRKAVRTSSRTGRKIITKNSSKNLQQSIPAADKTGGVKKAGEFNGDLRSLPKTKPADQEHPRPKEPPFKPIPAPTPAVKPPDN